MLIISALVAGLIFGIGLILSGMSNPAKVLSFLDVVGTWEPSLLLVMGAAFVIASAGFANVQKRGKPLFDTSLHLPQLKHIDQRLIAGSALFGIGWGLAGICPGPALVLLGQGKAFVFVVAMLAGMLLFERLQPRHK